MSYAILWPDPLQTSPLPGGRGLSRVTKEWRVYSERIHDSIILPVGFEFDWDSLKRWMPLSYAWLKGRAKLSSAIHDKLYRTGTTSGGKKISRRKADLVMYDCMVKEGIALRHRLAIYYGVRTGGWVSWRRYRKND